MFVKSKERHDLMNEFEGLFPDERLEAPDTQRKRVPIFYQDGEVDKLFLAFRLGYGVRMNETYIGLKPGNPQPGERWVLKSDGSRVVTIDPKNIGKDRVIYYCKEHESVSLYLKSFLRIYERLGESTSPAYRNKGDNTSEISQCGYIPTDGNEEEDEFNRAIADISSVQEADDEVDENSSYMTIEDIRAERGPLKVCKELKSFLQRVWR